MSYYKNQIDKLNLGQLITIKLSDEDGSGTNYMSVNHESIPEIRIMLYKIEKQYEVDKQLLKDLGVE